MFTGRGKVNSRSVYPVYSVGYVGKVHPLGTLGCKKRLGEE